MTSCLTGKREEEEVSGESHPLLIEDNQKLAVGKGRKRLCVLLSTLGLGVGLCLVIVLPLTLGVSTTTTNPGKGPGPKAELNGDAPASSFLSLMVHAGGSANNVEKRSGIDAMNGKTYVKNLYGKTRERKMTAADQFDPRPPTTPPRHPNLSPTSFPRETNTTVAPFCRTPPASRRGAIDLGQFNRRLLFEVGCIQSYDYNVRTIYDVTCAVKRFDLNLTAAGNVTNGVEQDVRGKGGGGRFRGQLREKWEEGGRQRVRVNALAELKPTETPNDWIIAVEEPPRMAGLLGYFSVLLERDDYIVTYACYPYPQLNFEPGYSIHVFVKLWAGPRVVNYRRVDELLRLTNVWGLNPGDYRPYYMPHNDCDYNIGLS